MKIIGSFPNTRLRRLRKHRWIRNIVSENNISHNVIMNVIKMFLQLDKEDQEKCLCLVNNILFPLKFYIILVVTLLFLIFCTNLYLINNINLLKGN